MSMLFSFFASQEKELFQVKDFFYSKVYSNKCAFLIDSVFSDSFSGRLKELQNCAEKNSEVSGFNFMESYSTALIHGNVLSLKQGEVVSNDLYK